MAAPNAFLSLLALTHLCSGATISNNETVTRIQTTLLETYVVQDEEKLADNCLVEMTLFTNAQFSPNITVALATRSSQPAEVSQSGDLLADQVDYSALFAHKSHHALTFSKATAVQAQFFISIVAFSRGALPIQYRLTLQSSSQPLCPASCSGIGRCQRNVCICSNGRFDSDCSFAPESFKLGQTVDVWVKKASRNDGYILTSKKTVQLAAKWTRGAIDILVKPLDLLRYRSEIPTYSESEVILIGASSPFSESLSGTEASLWFFSLINTGEDIVKVEISVKTDSEAEASNAVIAIICCSVGAGIIALWGSYVYIKIRAEMRTSAFPTGIYPILSPLNSAFSAAFPEEQYGNLPKSVNQNCAVCLEGYRGEDRVRHLVCNHVYHVGCIDKWMMTQKVRVVDSSVVFVRRTTATPSQCSPKSSSSASP